MTGHGSSGMDTEYRSRPVAYLLALKDAPDTTPRDGLGQFRRQTAVMVI